MNIDIVSGFKYGVLDYSQYIAELETNLDSSSIAFIDVYDSGGLSVAKSIFKPQGRVSIKFAKADLFNISSKWIARLYDTDGVFWADNFILQDGVVDIEFQSQGESSEVGELKTFSGSITQDGEPVSRSVYALAIGGDVPKLLASTVSDAAGDYSLQWNGYTGQILVTATDDYGDLFSAEALLSIGARVHPATPNGYVYEAASAGTIGLVEPIWPEVAGESVTSGEVQLLAVPFYRPKSAGPFTIT
jgi:hypothetical protein